MGRSIRHPRPDYVLNFVKPPHTEIKHINGKWYLYEVISRRAEGEARCKKTSGSILGAITPNGFEESKVRARRKAEQAQQESDEKKDARAKTSPIEANVFQAGQKNVASDSLEVGATTYFYERTQGTRLRLKKYFPDFWQVIYVIFLLRLIYEPKFKRLKTHYQYSILSEIFPYIDLCPAAIRSLLVEIGKRRSAIRNFMKEDIDREGTYLLIDGHRLITASKNRLLAEIGYDSKKRYKNQINVLYIFSLDDKSNLPAYYKQYLGSTPDVKAFGDIIKDCNIQADNVIAVTDKGLASDEDFNLLKESGVQYIIPLKRGNKYVKGKIPISPLGYSNGFVYENRSIFFNEIELEEASDFKVFIYCDIDLYNAEINTIMQREEKSNNENMLKLEREEQLRSKNKGKLSDEELAKLSPKYVEDIFKNKESVGTITLRVKSDNLNGEQAYNIWKTRQSIEQFFKTYDCTLDFDDSFMRDDTTEEGWLFLNHLSSICAMSTLNEIKRLDFSKKISLDDLRIKLRKIQADRIDGKWLVKPVKSEVCNMCNLLGIDVRNLSAFDGMIQWSNGLNDIKASSSDLPEEQKSESASV